MMKVSNLTFGYSRKSILFENLNLELLPGRIYGLLGKNAAGKSTLLKCLCGLIHPLSGSCARNNLEASNRQPAFLQELFFIADELYLPQLNVHQYVKSYACFYPKFDREQFFTILAEFEVPEGEDLNSLSLGQQKKVMIAFGIAANTSVLIMDEPTNALDIPSKKQFRKIIAAALTDEKIIVISTHQVRDLESLIDHILVLHERKMILNNSMDRIAACIAFSKIVPADPSLILYREDNLLGSHMICLNTSHHEGKVDLELLFNAMTTGHQPLLDVLK
ncbi:ATP-binding cassette domain-containing protein [Pedobacter sp. AW31-3R]|uniref:ATP-binding cassette domain-containing protein n=1 Tax=Pedobacter sp. AW31-3R TaxID=3445781 RepID=UPI003F9F1FF2